MGWVTLSLDTGHTGTLVNDYEFAIMRYNRDKRGVQRNLSVEKSRVNKLKKEEIKDAKKEYMEAKKGRPEDLQSTEYQEWQVKCQEAQTKYNEIKDEVEDYYDGIMEEIEEESTSEENFIDEQLTIMQAALESIRQDYSTTKESTSTDIQNTKLNLK